MAMKKTIAVIFGTRPDTIKLAPIILRLRAERNWCRVVTVATAQHRHMLDQVLDVFGIEPDHDLNIMRPRQTLAQITRNTIGALDGIMLHEKPDMVLVQGDTLTTFVGSLASFFRHVPVGHVEAGLRTNDKTQPFPEEMNRRLTSAIADLHFAPTSTARQALLHEHVPASSIRITGNSVIDALHLAVRKKHVFSTPVLRALASDGRRIILVTMHRRENWGEPMRGAALALRRIATEFPDVLVAFPVHKNPIVRDAVMPVLHDIPNVALMEPLDYMDFVHLMARAHLLITDSGGVQEEGPSLGKPVLVLREKTERPEAVRYGTVKLVGVDQQKIYTSARRLLKSKAAYRRMATAVNPYGDGHASERTVRAIQHYFGLRRDAGGEFKPKSAKRTP
jgi:UDP-N-acetylglucosamine 2-epimerase (non-hydrolysing)